MRATHHIGSSTRGMSVYTHDNRYDDSITQISRITHPTTVQSAITKQHRAFSSIISDAQFSIISNDCDRKIDPL